MKVKIKVLREVDLKLLIVKAGVRYWEDAKINGENDTENGDNIPCKIGDLWSPSIEVETGKILNWEQGVKAEIHYKVVDNLSYDIQDETGEIVLSAEEVYVPKTLCPKRSGYGDYIIMDIDENGQIANWNFNFEDFQEEED